MSHKKKENLQYLECKKTSKSLVHKKKILNYKLCIKININFSANKNVLGGMEGSDVMI